jgi:mannosyltransferase OCH1-like enzyme
MHVIWVGDESKRPDAWLQTWREKHPDWEYKVWGNAEFETHDWYNKDLIAQYLKEGRYPAVADCMRYQILYEEGGMVHPADSVCFHAIDELFEDGYDAYGVYENETVRPGLVSPLYAASKGNAFARALMENLPTRPPLAPRGGTKERPSKAPWQVTGNAYMKRMIESRRYAGLKILPSYTFTPIHHTGLRYEGDGKVYACQMWGTTTESGIGVKEYIWQR